MWTTDQCFVKILKLYKQIYTFIYSSNQIGFKNSKSGYFGNGVYMSECSDTAFLYSAQFSDSDNENNTYIFVNEVMETEKLKDFRYNSYNTLERVSLYLIDPFRKYMFKRSPSIETKSYIRDSKGRRYRNVAVNKWSIMDEYVANQHIVKPRYIISLVTDINLEVFNCVTKFVNRKF